MSLDVDGSISVLEARSQSVLGRLISILELRDAVRVDVMGVRMWSGLPVVFGILAISNRVVRGQRCLP